MVESKDHSFNRLLIVHRHQHLGLPLILLSVGSQELVKFEASTTKAKVIGLGRDKDLGVAPSQAVLRQVEQVRIVFLIVEHFAHDDDVDRALANLILEVLPGARDQRVGFS